LTTSVGFATQIPTAPVVNAAKIFLYNGISPTWSFPTYNSLTVSYKPILIEANTSYLWRPAPKPLNNANGPSSAAIVKAVFINPLYFPTSPFFNWVP